MQSHHSSQPSSASVPSVPHLCFSQAEAQSDAPREIHRAGSGGAAAAAAAGPRQRKGRKDEPTSPKGLVEDFDLDAGEDELDDNPFERTIGEGVIDAVVKVFCTHTEPNYSLPWQRKRQMASTSSGFIIPGARPFVSPPSPSQPPLNATRHMRTLSHPPHAARHNAF